MDGLTFRKFCSSHNFHMLRFTFNHCNQRRPFHYATVRCQRSREEKHLAEETAEEGFRTYEIKGLKQKVDAKQKQRKKRQVPPPRFQQMPTDQDWTNVWPAASTFKWSVVPFPVRQGFVEKTTENDGVIPSKYANAELMKIPNFLHLTPVHIKKHCAALKEFCTEWPKGLETDEACQKHFPVEVQSSDYVFSGPSIRDPRARTVTVTLHLSNLELDYRARDKFIRLVGDCYKPESDKVVFTSDRCPMKKQNYDYIMYLLSAAYHESWKFASWEHEKTEEDMEKYVWNISKSKEVVVKLLQSIKNIDEESSVPDDQKLQYLPNDTSEGSLLTLKEVEDYRNAASDLINDGETEETLQRYGQAVRKLLGIKGGLKAEVLV